MNISDKILLDQMDNLISVDEVCDFIQRRTFTYKQVRKHFKDTFQDNLFDVLLQDEKASSSIFIGFWEMYKMYLVSITANDLKTSTYYYYDKESINWNYYVTIIGKTKSGMWFMCEETNSYTGMWDYTYKIILSSSLEELVEHRLDSRNILKLIKYRSRL